MRSTASTAAPPRREGVGQARGALVRETRAAWILLGPLAFFFALFFAFPIVLAFYESFRSVQRSGLGMGESTAGFAGINNYKQVLSDPAVIAGFGRVFIIGIIQVPVMMGLAILMALLFDAGVVWGKKYFQTVAFLPHAIPGVIAALVWGALYLPQISPIVKGLGAIGLQADFLSEHAVLFSVMNITTWSWTGYNMVILYAALQSIPREILESASVEGAGGFAQAFHIKLPLIVPGLVITVVFSIIGSLQQFADPSVLRTFTTSIDSKFTPNMAIFSMATSGSPQAAAALSVLLALLAFVLSLGVLRIRDRTESK